MNVDILVPEVNHDAEPPLRRCACGAEHRWVWYAPRGPTTGVQGAHRWCSPKVNPCSLCVVTEESLAEREVVGRLYRAGVPAPLHGYALTADRVVKQGTDEAPDVFQARVRALGGSRLGILACNAAALKGAWLWSPPDWLVLHGPPGTGKTTWLAGLARRLLAVPPSAQLQLPEASVMARGGQVAWDYAVSRGLAETRKAPSWVPVTYETVPELMRREQLRAKGLDEHPLRDLARAPGVLMLDELGCAPKPSSWEQDQVERILVYRHNHRLPTIIATNRSFAELSGQSGQRPPYGERVADRLRTAVDVRLGGPSWR